MRGVHFPGWYIEVMTVLVVGAGGRLGREFMDRLSSLDDLTGLTHVQCDIADSLAVERTVLELQPTVVINCAAQPSVDVCEKERDQAYRINVLGARNVAHAAYRVAAKVVHISTDYVFDGTADHAYTEWDTPNPINWYGRTKLCLLYTSDAADDLLCVDLGGRRIIKKKKKKKKKEK